MGRITDILKRDGVRGLCVTAARRVLGRLYDSTEMVYVERTLQDVTPRYGLKGGFAIEEITLADVEAVKYPFLADKLALARDVFAEGCRMFVGHLAGEPAGWMLVGQRCRVITERVRYQVEVGEKDIVNFDIFIFPPYRKSKAAGALKEAVMLKLRDEGYHRMLGAIDVTNRPSLSLARHFGFHEVKRVRIDRLGSFTRRRERPAGGDDGAVLIRPKRDAGKGRYVDVH